MELQENPDIEMMDFCDDTKKLISSYWADYYDLSSEIYVYEMIFYEAEKDVFFSFRIEVSEKLDVTYLRDIYESVSFK